MKEEKSNINYTADYIQRYLDGQLSHPEMQAIEKAALDDPFLSDAIEGIEESRRQAVSFESGLNDLHNRLTQRIRERNRKNGLILLFSKWNIAASILIILGATTLTIIYMNRHSNRNEIAKSTVKDSGKGNKTIPLTNNITDTAATVAIDKKSEMPVSDKETITKADQRDLVKKSRQKKMLPLNQVNPGDKFNRDIEPAPAISLSRVSVDSILKTDVTTSTERNDRTATVITGSQLKEANGKNAGAATSDLKISQGNYIKGVVTDDKGKPIPFASVSVKGSRTTTDMNGFFKLYMTYPNLVSPVMFNSTGFYPVSTEMKFDSSLTNLIQLQPASTALKEVEVTGYATNAEQPIGWEAFKNYINENKKILTEDSLLKGDEIVSFEVDNKSQLSSFNIEESLSPSHDDEVIRLIKKAPALIIRKGKKQQFRIIISFN